MISTLPAQDQFLELPQRKYIYLSSEVESGWYHWDSEKQARSPIPFPALSGVLTSLRLIERESPRGKVNKLLVVLRNYTIVMGKDTYAAKSFLWDLSHHVKHFPDASPEVIISPKKGKETSNVVFLRVRLNLPQLQVPLVPRWPDKTDEEWNELIEQLVDEINQWLNHSPQMSQDNNEDNQEESTDSSQMSQDNNEDNEEESILWEGDDGAYDEDEIPF